MRKDSSSYKVWNPESFLLGKEGSEIANLLEANKLKDSLMVEIRELHSVINTAMATSLISYSFKKMERK